MNKYLNFARNFIMIGISDIVSGVSSYVLVIIITKSVNAYAYGVFSQMNTTVGLLVPLTVLGLSHSIIRFLESENSKPKVFYSTLLTVFISGVIVFGLFVNFSSVFKDFLGSNGIVILVGLIILVWSLDTIYINYYVALQKIKRYSLILIIESLSKVLLVGIVILLKLDTFYIILVILVERFAIFILMAKWVKDEIGFTRPGLIHKEYLKYGIPLVCVSIAGWMVTAGDRYVISYFWNLTEVGIYSASYMIGNTPYILSALLSTVLIPVVSKLYDNKKIDEIKVYLNYCMKYFLCLVIPFIFGALLLSNQVLNIFTTETIALRGENIVPVIALGTLFFGMYVVYSMILIMQKKTKTIALVWAIAGVMNVLLNILVVPRLGIAGASLTTLFTYMLVWVIVWALTKEIKIEIDFKFIVKCLVSSGIMSFIILLIRPSNNIITLETIFCGVVIYAAILHLLKGFSRSEMDLFKGLIKR